MKNKGNTATRFKRLTVDANGKERGTSQAKHDERQIRKLTLGGKK